MRRLFVMLLSLSLLFVAACQASQPAPAPDAMKAGVSAATPAPAVVSPVAPSGSSAAVSATTTPRPTLEPPKFTLKGGDGKTVATVNGTAISLGEYTREATAARDEMVDGGVDIASTEGKAQLKEMYSQVLEQLIVQEIVRQGAKAQGIAVSDDDVKKELDKLTAQQGGEEGLKKAMDAQGLTREDLNSLIRDRLSANQLADLLTKDLPTTGEQIHARHILVKTEDEAKKVKERLAAGEDFAAVARDVSTDPGGKSNGGDLGWLAKGQTVPAFEDAAFALPLKKVSDPVQSQFGYHIIEVLEKDDKRPLPQDRIDELKQDKLVNWLDAQRKGAKVEQFLSLE